MSNTCFIWTKRNWSLSEWFARDTSSCGCHLHVHPVLKCSVVFFRMIGEMYKKSCGGGELIKHFSCHKGDGDSFSKSGTKHWFLKWDLSSAECSTSPWHYCDKSILMDHLFENSQWNSWWSLEYKMVWSYQPNDIKSKNMETMFISIILTNQLAFLG